MAWDGKLFLVGDRVRVRNDAGFHKGAEGVIVPPPPEASRPDYCHPFRACWVLRDRSGGPVWYHPSELDLNPK